MNLFVRYVLGLTAAWCALIAAADEQSSHTPVVPSTILDRVAERAKVERRNDREFRQLYAYTRSRTTEYRTGSGTLRKRETQRAEHHPSPPVAIASLSIGTTNEPAAAESAPSEVRQDANGEIKGRAFERRDFPLNDELLKRFQFTLAGHDTLHGRSALVVDFKPASKDLPVHNIKDRFINKAAGRVWIDEADFAIAKVDVHLTEPISIIGGLVGAVHKCQYSFARERTSEGLWFTTNVTWHLEGRQFLSSKMIDYYETREDVRKAW